MRSTILYFFLLILEVIFNPTPDNVHKSLRISEILLEECFELDARQRTFGSLVSQIMLVPLKAYMVIQE